jgi:hypothetical protein
LGVTVIVIVLFAVSSSPSTGAIVALRMCLPGVALLVMLLAGYVAWGTYRLSINAWWCAVLLIIAWSLSTVITFSRVSILVFYEKMNFPEQQLDRIKQFSISQDYMVLFLGLWAVAFLGYLLYTRIYFVPPPEQEIVSQQTLP